jgi:DNA ligase (NAD+)
MDIDGVGPALVERLTSALPGNLLGDESRLVRSFADLYRLTPEDLMQLEGIKQKSAANIVEAIQGSKSRGPARLLAGIAIAGIGVSAAKKIIKKFRSFDALEQTTSPDDFLTVEDVGTVLAQNLFDFFHSEEGLRIVADLRSVGLDMALEPLSEEETSAAKPLEGKTICATGTLVNYDRSEIKETIERFGGKASSSVSKKTTFLLVGSNPGAAKVDKAAELGVPTITEEEFQAMIEAE